MDLIRFILPIQKKKSAPEMRMRLTQKETELRDWSEIEREPVSLEHLGPASPAAHNPQAFSYMSQYNGYFYF